MLTFNTTAAATGESPLQPAPEAAAEPDQKRAPDEGDGSRDGSKESQKRKAEREPESPGNNEMDGTFPPFSKREKIFYPDLEHDSPASYPKHVLVPAADREAFEEKPGLSFPIDPPRRGNEGSSVLTPDSAVTRRDSHPEGSGFSRDPGYPDVFRAPSYQEIDYNNPGQSFTSPSRASYEPPRTVKNTQRPRRWACDYCNVATFLSYEEACAHEAECARRHEDMQNQQYCHPAGPHVTTPYEGRPMTQMQQHGAHMYHPSQEIVTPPTPHQHHPSRFAQGPPLPILPPDQGYYHSNPGYFDPREDHYYNQGRMADPYGYYQGPPPTSNPYGYMSSQIQRQPQQKRMLLAMPTDNESLSDRQCYVRSEMLEIFAATDKDVAARHSKGAQKLQPGQVGIRCVHCAHMRPRDRAERAVCYPSSISRIYQTVADMQRFHFEQCQQIPDFVRQVYGKLKTTRPRGVGSPQTYWIQSAKALGLADTEMGIRFKSEGPSGETPEAPAIMNKGHSAATAGIGKNSDMSISTL